MGSNMSLLFAEHGIQVSVIDKVSANVKNLIKIAKTESLDSRIHAVETYKELATSVGSGTTPKVFLLSLPHGGPGDSVIEELSPFLREGDVILDGSE